MRLLFAPADRGLPTDPVPSTLAACARDAGIEVALLEDPEPHGNGDVALSRMLQDAASDDVIGGISRGARLAVQLAHTQPVAGVLLFSFPFHPRRNPDPGERVGWVNECAVPVFLAQGTRDAMGNREQIRGYGLQDAVTLHWVTDGNHNLLPRVRSGVSHEQAVREACAAAVAWMRAL